MKQTSIEWLSEQLLNLDIEFDTILINRANYWIKRNNIIEQAKEMHKQEISRAYFSGWDEELDRSGEQYYNETYNK